MNKNIIFSGEVKEIQEHYIKQEDGSKLLRQKILFEVKNLVNRKVEKKLFYITYWGNSNLEKGDKKHLICDLLYRRVTSEKAWTLDKEGLKTKFEYANWDFLLREIFDDNDLLLKWLYNNYIEWVELQEKEETKKAKLNDVNDLYNQLKE